MKKIFAVIKKEYKIIVQKKSFIIMTVLTPVLMAGMMFVPVLLMKMGRTEKKIAVADYAGGYYQALSAKPAAKQAKRKGPGHGRHEREAGPGIVGPHLFPAGGAGRARRFFPGA